MVECGNPNPKTDSELPDYQVVNFNRWVKDWRGFADGLNESLPGDVIVDFRFGNPLWHEFFCPFIFRLERKWRMETQLGQPGVQCLRARPELTNRCVEIVAWFGDEVRFWGLEGWLAHLVRLTELGYNIKGEVPKPVNLSCIQKYVKRRVELNLEVVIPSTEVKPTVGFSRKGERSCNGEASVIWDDGKYYPCYWCVTGALNNPVYAYGELGEPFERRGRESCKLRWCPLE
jgi:hypothetical protein